MDRQKILLQLDTDEQPSTFDSIVAIDAGEVDRLLRYNNVTPYNVRSIVHGAIFTRGPDDLSRTAIFIGGTDVAAAEAVMTQVLDTFFGPLRVSVMLDPNGANTTAVAAVRAASRTMELAGAETVVLGATGPVGQRVVRLLAREQAHVRVGSRRVDRAQAVCNNVGSLVEGAKLTAYGTETDADITKLLDGAHVVVAAGAAGVELLTRDQWQNESLKVAIDLNAVPPLGIAGIEVADRGTERSGIVCYGALGVGTTKMRLHRLAVKLLFEQRDKVLDAEELFEIGRGL